MFINDYIEKKRRKERTEAAKKAAIAVGVGIAAGVTAGVLLAPKSGKETRADIANAAEKAAEMAKTAAIAVKEELLNKETQVENDIKELAEGLKESLNKKIDDAATTMEDVKDKTKSTVADVAGTVEEKAKQIKIDASE